MKLFYYLFCLLLPLISGNVVQYIVNSDINLTNCYNIDLPYVADRNMILNNISYSASITNNCSNVAYVSIKLINWNSICIDNCTHFFNIQSLPLISYVAFCPGSDCVSEFSRVKINLQAFYTSYVTDKNIWIMFFSIILTIVAILIIIGITTFIYISKRKSFNVKTNNAEEQFLINN